MFTKEKIQIRTINIERELRSVKTRWKVCEAEKKKVLEFIRDLELGKVTGNIMVSGTLLSYITNLKIGLEFLNKPVDKLIPIDTEKMHEALLKDDLKWNKKKKINNTTITIPTKYSDSGKIKIKNSTILYLSWRLGDKADKLIKILKIKKKQELGTPDYLSEEEVEKLYDACSTNEQKFFISVMFDAGPRAQEFYNLRFEDIHLPKKGENFVKVVFKQEYSKTKGRTVSLYWKHSLKSVTDFLDERKREGIQPLEPVFKKKYKTIRNWLADLGQKVLGKNVHHHLFKHASATFYCSKLNRQELCYKYSWTYRSPMPDRYINREGANNKDLDLKFEKSKISELQEQIENFEHKSKLKDEDVKQLKEQVVKMAAENKNMAEQFKQAVAMFKNLNVTENY